MKLKTIPSWIDLLQGVVLWNFRAHKSKIKIKKNKTDQKNRYLPSWSLELTGILFPRVKGRAGFQKKKKKMEMVCGSLT